MPENEFEKQVKELMEELHYSPSAPVWEKIRKRINEKKRRVWPIFFLLLSFALVSGYLFYADINNADKNASKNATAIQNPATKNSPNNNTRKQEENNDKESAVGRQSQHPAVIKKINNNNHVVTANNFKDQMVRNNSSIKKNNAQKIVAAPHQNEYANTQSPATANSAADSNNSNRVIAQNLPDIKTNSGEDNTINNADTVTKAHEQVNTESIVTTAKKSPDKKIKKKNWQWGISAMYGSSTISDKLFTANADKSLQNSNPGTVAGYYPSALKNPYNNNTAYNFGLVVKRKIFKQSSLNTGINFVHLSVKSNTVLGLDSSLVPVAAYTLSNTSTGVFYRLGSAKTYTSSFNFIEIPVTFQSSLFHIHNFSMLYNGGISVMRLVSSDALIYNNHTRNFFIDDDLLRRTQLQLKAGLDFQLKMKNSSILLGPNLSYSLSPYLKTDDYGRLHLLHYGVQASWIFNKK